MMETEGERPYRVVYVRSGDGFFVLYGLLALALAVGTFGVGIVVGLMARLEHLAILAEYIIGGMR